MDQGLTVYYTSSGSYSDYHVTGALIGPSDQFLVDLVTDFLQDTGQDLGGKPRLTKFFRWLTMHPGWAEVPSHEFWLGHYTDAVSEDMLNVAQRKKDRAMKAGDCEVDVPENADPGALDDVVDYLGQMGRDGYAAEVLKAADELKKRREGGG